MSEATPRVDRLILGHNSFYGVDHLSRERGRERMREFRETDRIVAMLRLARTEGAGGMMVSSMPEAVPFLDQVRQNAELSASVNFYPLIPHAQSLVRQANEVGLFNLVVDRLPRAGFGGLWRLMRQGAGALSHADVLPMLGALIDLELSLFRQLRVRAVFLHPALTDLALGLGLPRVFEFFLDHVERVTGTQAGVCTLNLPLLLQRFAAWGIAQPLVMASINRAGFRMNPSRAAYEEALAKTDADVVAMGVLASGHLSLDEAFEYVLGLPRIAGVVLGASSPAHIRASFKELRCRMGA